MINVVPCKHCVSRWEWKQGDSWRAVLLGSDGPAGLFATSEQTDMSRGRGRGGRCETHPRTVKIS